jgi:hypothetical protein
LGLLLRDDESKNCKLLICRTWTKVLLAIVDAPCPTDLSLCDQSTTSSSTILISFSSVVVHLVIGHHPALHALWWLRGVLDLAACEGVDVIGMDARGDDEVGVDDVAVSGNGGVPGTRATGLSDGSLGLGVEIIIIEGVVSLETFDIVSVVRRRVKVECVESLWHSKILR